MKTSLGQLSLKYIGPKIWSNIPEKLKSSSPYSFGKKFKKSCYLDRLPVHLRFICLSHSVWSSFYILVPFCNIALMPPVAARDEIGREGCEISSLVACPSPRFSSRGAKNQMEGQKKGRHIFKIQYWMYAATGGPNVKWGAPISNGGAGQHWSPLATDLSGWTYGIVVLAVFIISGVFSHSSSPNLIKLVIFSCPYWYIASV